MSNAETIASMAQKQSKNALQRLDGLEQSLQQIVGALNNTMGPLQQQLSQAVEVLDAVVAILGPDVVAAKVNESRLEKATQTADEQKRQVAALLDQGILVKADKVSERSLIVGKELKDGQMVPPGRRQALYQQVRPDFQQSILGQAIGFKVDTGDGLFFEISEIYDIMEKSAAPEATAPAAVAAEEVK